MSGKLRLYSSTPGNNNAAPPDGWPEGMAPSTVNNSARQMMAQLAEWYRDAEWIDYGTVVVTAAGQVYTLTGDVTATYTVGRAIRQNGSAVGLITASVYSVPNTLVTVSGFVPSAAPSSVEVGIGDKATSRVSSGASAIDFAAYNGNVQVKVNGVIVATGSPASLAVGLNAAQALGAAGTLVNLNVHTTGTTTSDVPLITLSSAATANNAFMGAITFGSTGLSAGDKRTAQITGTKRDALTVNPVGDIIFQTANGAPRATRLTIQPDGAVDLATGALNGVAGADIASAATVNLDTATGNVVNVTGSVTITAFTLTNGRERVIRFTGTPQITNGASLVIMPTLATTGMQIGDMATVTALGGVKYVRVFRANGDRQLLASGGLGTDTAVTLPVGTWKQLEVVLDNVSSATAFSMYLRFNADTAANYRYTNIVRNDTGGSSIADSSGATGYLVGGDASLITATTGRVSARFIIYAPSTAVAHGIDQKIVGLVGGVSSYTMGAGAYTNAVALTSVSFLLRNTIGASPTGAAVAAATGTYAIWADL